eukprot:gene11253-10867_t
MLIAGILTYLAASDFVLLEPETYHGNFVEGWPGPYINGTGAGEINETVFRWATENLPLFETSDADMQAAYYYRAKSYHSHMNPTDYVDQPILVSEFGSAVHWGGPFGTINAAADRDRSPDGHHISEGRWIRDHTPMNSNIKFWLGSMAPGNDQTTPHHADGSKGAGGSTPYTEWIVAATLKRSQVLGEFALGNDMHGKEVDMVDVLDGMSVWWEKRTLQTRLDCQMAQKNNLPGALDCAAAPPGKYDYPFCYITDDGWDAME